MTLYPFLLDEFLDEYHLTREEFADIIGKDVNGMAKIELRRALTTVEHSKLCRVYGKDAVAEFYAMRPAMRFTHRGIQNMQ